MSNTQNVNDTTTKNNINTLPIPKTIFNPENIKQELASQGLNGLNFDYGSFPCITLQGSNFLFSDDADFNLKSFDIQIIQTTQKHILVDLNDPDYQDVKYSIDGKITTDGEPIELLIKNMEAENRKPILKRYLDVLCQLKTDDKHHEKLVVLSISPTSVSRVSDFFLQLKLQGLISQLNNLTITVSRGAQRTSKGGKTYHLWQLERKEQLKIAA
jgi:hypothetical protein